MGKPSCESSDLREAWCDQRSLQKVSRTAGLGRSHLATEGSCLGDNGGGPLFELESNCRGAPGERAGWEVRKWGERHRWMTLGPSRRVSEEEAQ